MAAGRTAVADYRADSDSLSAVLAPLRPLGRSDPNTCGEFGVDPTECALVIMDYQPVILRSTPDAGELISGVNAAVEHVRRGGGHVAFVRTAFQAADYRFIPSTNRALSGVAADKFLPDGTPGTALHTGLARRPGDLLIRKVRVGAFSTTGLDEWLTNRGVTTVILAGVHTSGVVLSTVRAAADRDYRVIVLSDCTSDADPEVHDILMERILPSQADIATVAEVSAWLDPS